MKKPSQTLFTGDVVQVQQKGWWPYFSGGEIGIVVKTFCHKVCVKGGTIGLSPEMGGPEYAMEWGYVGLFSGDKRRLDCLSPITIILPACKAVVGNGIIGT